MEKEEAEFQQPQFTEKQQFMITNPGGRDQPTAQDEAKEKVDCGHFLKVTCNLDQNQMLSLHVCGKYTSLINTHRPVTITNFIG